MSRALNSLGVLHNLNSIIVVGIAEATQYWLIMLWVSSSPLHKLGMVAHTCNPSYSGVLGQESLEFKVSLGKLTYIQSLQKMKSEILFLSYK